MSGNLELKKFLLFAQELYAAFVKATARHSTQETKLFFFSFLTEGSELPED
jgi:hypothetical protein